eukprot:3671517-Pyramimonas_sp.AAC.1
MEVPIVPATARGWQADYRGLRAWATLHARAADWPRLREKLKDPAQDEHAWRIVDASLSAARSPPRLLPHFLPHEREARTLRII